MPRNPLHIAAAMLALVSFGCDPDELSDKGQYWVEVGLESPLGSYGHHALVGSTFRLEIHRVAREGQLDQNGGGPQCATQSGSGVVVELYDDEFSIEAAGNGAVELADPSISCPLNEDILAQLGPDRWSVIGVEPTDVIGRWGYEPDMTIAAYGHMISPGPRGVYPDFLGRPLDEVRVVADSEFAIYPALVLEADNGEEIEVRWADDDNELVVPAHYDDLRPRDSDGKIDQWLRGTLPAGVSFDASVTILGNSFQLPPIRAVPVEHITSLELVPIYGAGDDQREWGPPVGVIAITRDGEGRRVLDAPVEYELTRGRLDLYPARGDTLSIEGVCRRPVAGPTARSATVVATLGQLEESVDLEWVALPSDTDPCTDSCACTSTPPGESTPGLLALFGLGLWLRRRRAPLLDDQMP